jgi:hypothetical protein
MSAQLLSFPETILPDGIDPSHMARVTFETTDEAIEHFADWPCGWTHYIDWRKANLRTWKTAVRWVETFAPEATSHLDHLRTMRDIEFGSTCSEAQHAMWKLAGYKVRSVFDPMPEHGPERMPVSDELLRAAHAVNDVFADAVPAIPSALQAKAIQAAASAMIRHSRTPLHERLRTPDVVAVLDEVALTGKSAHAPFSDSVSDLVYKVAARLGRNPRQLQAEVDAYAAAMDAR